MTCPICDQKPANCDCTAEERRQYGEIEDLECEVSALKERLKSEHAIAVSLQAIIDRLRAERRWIPVNERLPVDGQQVLMAYRFPDDNTCATWPHIVQEVRMSTADFLNGDFTEVDDAVRYTRQSVSHWMPLPEPPEGK